MLREFSIGSYEHMKSDKNIKQTLSDHEINEAWKPSEGINWDAIQRRRFMNADAEIDPEDNYSKKWKKEINE